MATEEENTPTAVEIATWEAAKSTAEAAEGTTKAVRIASEINAATSQRVKEGIFKSGIASAEDIVKGFEDALATDASLTDTASRQKVQTELQRAQKNLSELNAKHTEQLKLGQEMANDILEANRPIFAGMLESLKSGFSALGSSIKSDFSMLAGPLNALQATPGMKTIITILKIIGMWVAKLGLKLLTAKGGPFSGLAKKDPKTGALDVKGTLGMFGKWAKGVVGAGPKISRKKDGEKAKAKSGLTEDTAGKSGVIDPSAGMSQSQVVKQYHKNALAQATEAAKAQITFQQKVDSFHKGMIKGWDNIKEKTAKKFEGMKNKVKGFYEGMSEGWGNMKEKLGPKFEGMKNKVDSFHEGMNKGWDNIKKNTGKKFMSMKKGVTDNVSLMGDNLKDMASGMSKSVKGAPMKALKLFRRASTAITGTFMKMGKVMLKFVLRMAPIIISFIIASLLFLGSMIMSIAALIAPAIPYILIGIAIALLVAGLIWLGMKIVENWDAIKERFSMAMEQLGIWTAKAAHWLGGMFAPIEDKVRYFFAMLMDGLASMVNAAIEWINAKADWLPFVGPNLIEGRMSEGNVEAAANAADIRAAERATSGEEIAERQAALDDRKAAYDAGGTKQPTGDTNQQVVVNQSTTRKHVAVNLVPTDGYAGELATVRQ